MRTRLLLLAFTTCALAFPAAASAATTIGDVSDPTDGSCGTDEAFMQASAAGDNYVVPINGGVITRWSFRSGLAAATGAKLKLFTRTTDPSMFKVVAEDGFRPVTTANAVTTYASRIRAPGDSILGLSVEGPGSTECAVSIPGDVIEFPNAPPFDPPTGTTSTMVSQDGYRMSIAAVVEPDADRDGYGDETQDGCPAKATLHSGCVLSAPSISGKTEKGKTLTATPGSVQGGTPTYQWLRGSGTQFAPIAGATGSAYQLTSKDRGKQIEVTEKSSNSQGSDSATSAPTAVIGPPSIKTAIKATQRVLKQHGVVVKLKPNVASALTATGTIALPKGVAKVLRFKRVKRSLKGGKTTKVTLKLSRKSLASLKRVLVGKRKLKAKLVLTLKDKAGGRTVAKPKVKLKR